MSILTTAEKLQYASDGFIVAKNLVTERESVALYETAVDLAHKYDSSIPLSLKERRPWVDEEFNTRLLSLRKENPERFGALYDCLQISLSTQRSVCNENISRVAAELLKDRVAGLTATGHMMRLDPPHDSRNSLAWHQEAGYYVQNLVGDHGLVVWFPLHDHTANLGPILVCPKSQREGLQTFERRAPDNGKSEQLTIRKSLVEKYSPRQIVIPFGDVVFFHMHLFHRSGENLSEQIRFSAGVRFSRMLTQDFLPGRFHYRPNETVGRLSNDKK